MAERKDPSLESGSLNPLFNKMDALLSRHRGRSGEQIPVLTEEASVMQIPTLTEEIRHDHTVMKINTPAKQDLMFHPAEFAWLNPDAVPASDKPKEPDPPLVEIPKLYPTQVAPLPDPAAPSVMLDLPVLNLNALMPEPESPAPSFELEIDEHEVAPPVAEVATNELAEPKAIQIEAAIEPELQTEELAIVAMEVTFAEDTAEIQTSDAEPAVIEPPLALDAQESSADEPLLITHAAVPEEYLIDLDSLANEHDFLVADEHIEPVQEIIAEQVEADSYLEITATAPQEPEELIAQPVSSGDHFEEITAIPLPEEPIVEAATESAIEPEPVLAPRLDAATLDEITAHVGAHIAVDITTEVSQLARQHFTRIMNGYYQQALQQLTEEISRDMESLLAPRITELVKQELKDRGFISE